MSALRWTCKSTKLLSEDLKKRGHRASARLVASLLHKLKYRLQGNQKMKAGKQHPDRNAQFEYIKAQATKQMRARNHVISVDIKKKELVGNYKNNGSLIFPVEDSICRGLNPLGWQTGDSLRDPGQCVGRDGTG